MDDLSWKDKILAVLLIGLLVLSIVWFLAYPLPWALEMIGLERKPKVDPVPDPRVEWAVEQGLYEEFCPWYGCG